MRSFFFLLFVSVSCFGQPSWLPLPSKPTQPPPPAVQPPGGGGEKPRVVYRDKVIDRIVRDTVFRVDTIVRVDTVVLVPVQYKYIIRYALTALNVDTKNPEWMDYSSTAEIIARDTASLRVGSEDLRQMGNLIDQFGNRIPQYDLITTGFTIQVMRDRATIEYRSAANIALFSGSFDSSGYLIASGEISESSMLAGIFPFNLFMGVSKKRIIIEIVREVLL